jgi:hypothetical protein
MDTRLNVLIAGAYLCYTLAMGSRNKSFPVTQPMRVPPASTSGLRRSVPISRSGFSLGAWRPCPRREP